MPYRLVGHEEVDLSWEDLEQLIGDGSVGPETQVRRDQESEPTALSERPEFAHLFRRSSPEAPRSADHDDRCKFCRRRLVAREPVCPWCGKDLVVKPGQASQYSQLTATISLGRHVGGHPALAAGELVSAASDGFCLFFFERGNTANRNTWMSLRALRTAQVVDETTVLTETRHTLTRVALLGILALAAPKVTTRTERRFVLILRWTDGDLEQEALFRFAGPLAEREARSAAEFLNRVRIWRVP